MEQQNHKYYAFISYNSKDFEWGKRVQWKLEHYRMPAKLCREYGWKRNPINPVFFAPTDIQPGGLSEELQERLRASRNLIVICSPNSAKSEWVGKEVEFFHQLGRTKEIHFFIVDGEPHSGNPDTECFNDKIDELGLPEILGANIHERIYRWPWLNNERAYVQLISKLLGVEFDAIWRRHRRLLIQRAIAWTIGAVVVLVALFGVWKANQPMDVEARLKEATVHNENLPALKDAIVTMTLDNETKTDTIPSLDNAIVFTNIPHRYLNQEVHMTVTCQDYLAVDTLLLLTKDVTLDIRRNPKVYGDVHFRLWNPDIEQTLPNRKVEVAGMETKSDENGHVSVFVPLEQQRIAYDVTVGTTINDIIHMPCGEDDVILIK